MGRFGIFKEEDLFLNIEDLDVESFESNLDKIKSILHDLILTIGDWVANHGGNSCHVIDLHDVQSPAFILLFDVLKSVAFVDVGKIFILGSDEFYSSLLENNMNLEFGDEQHMIFDRGWCLPSFGRPFHLLFCHGNHFSFRFFFNGVHDLECKSLGICLWMVFVWFGVLAGKATFGWSCPVSWFQWVPAGFQDPAGENDGSELFAAAGENAAGELLAAALGSQFNKEAGVEQNLELGKNAESAQVVNADSRLQLEKFQMKTAAGGPMFSMQFNGFSGGATHMVDLMVYFTKTTIADLLEHLKKFRMTT